jgi:hypothetical protein
MGLTPVELSLNENRPTRGLRGPGFCQSIHGPATPDLVTRSGARYDTTDLVCRSGMYKSDGGIAIS